MKAGLDPADLASTDAERRRAALEHLIAAPVAALDDALVAAVIECLAVPVKAVQRLAADLVQRVPEERRAPAVARLRVALESTDAEGRWGAAYTLGRLGLAEPAMITPLLGALGGADGDRRWAAATLLATCARARPDLVLPALVAATGDADTVRRKMALYALRDAAPTHPHTRAAALRGLGDASVGVRFAALAALVRLEPAATEACARVVALAREDVDDGVRRAALCALGTVGRGISAAEDAIAEAAASDDPRWRRAAAIARRHHGG